MNLYFKKRSFSFKKIIIGPLSLLLFIAVMNLFQAPVRNSFQFIYTPVSGLAGQAGKTVSDFFQSFTGYKNLRQENKKLQEENQRLWSEIIATNAILNENQRLTEALQNTKDDNFEIVLARVIGIDVANGFILVDKGSDQGISEKMPLISSTKVLYGVVFKVYKDFSQVMLISNQNSAVNVKVISAKTARQEQFQEENPSENKQSNQTPIYGIVKGEGNLSIYLDLVNYESNIDQDNVLVTSALGEIYPKNLLVGRITDIIKDDLKPFQEARIQPFFNIKNIEDLFVIKNHLK